MTTEASDGIACTVCGDSAPADGRSDCYVCGEYFHLRLTNTAEGPDCGDVWIDDEVMALQFACRRCLDERVSELQPAPPDPPVLEEAQPTRRIRRAAPGASARDLARRRRR